MKMKKLMILIPLLALTGCQEPIDAFMPYLNEVDGIPTMHMYAGDHTTYLMMSPFGFLNISGAPVKGKVTSKFYENTITWVAEAGSALPTKEEVESTVTGATFRGWAFYNEDNDNVFPDYYTTVPAQSGLALKAIFDGTDSGGSQGDLPSQGFGLLFGDNTYLIASDSDEPDPTGQFRQMVITNANFVAGQTFRLYDFANEAGWIVPIDGWSFGGASGTDTKWKQYLSAGSDKWSVLTNFTATVYIKLKMNEDQIYFGLA